MTLMEKVLFVDLDGTMARFYEHTNYLEKMYERGYFANLRPYDSLVYAVQQIALQKKMRVIILSTYPGENRYAKEEKEIWLHINLPHGGYEEIIVPMHYSKPAEAEKYLGRKLGRNDYLLDDYTKNLKAWEKAGGTGIKCVNEVQGRVDKNSFTGFRISPEDDPSFIINTLNRLVFGNPENEPCIMITTVLKGIVSRYYVSGAISRLNDRGVVFKTTDGRKVELPNMNLFDDFSIGLQ